MGVVLVLAGSLVLLFGVSSFSMSRSHRWTENVTQVQQTLPKWLRGIKENTVPGWQRFGRRLFKVSIVLGPALIVVGLVWLIFSLPKG
ncbi:MAG: hypothetical protein ABSA22_07810 [Acidimicrobiales bacterium]